MEKIDSIKISEKVKQIFYITVIIGMAAAMLFFLVRDISNAFKEKEKQTEIPTTIQTTETTTNINDEMVSIKNVPSTTETTTENVQITEKPTTTEKPTETTTKETTTKPKETTTEDKSSEKLYSASYFRRMGKLRWGGFEWTWYSEKVLPGNGLNIQGRHNDNDGYVCDENDYICIASDDYSNGTVVDTPLGKQGKVYDHLTDDRSRKGIIDVYVGW